MTSPRAASLAKPIAYAPDTAFSLNLTFPESYDLSTKWIRFEARKAGSSTVVFSVDEDSDAIGYSSQTISVNVLPATSNDVTDGDDWGDIIDTVHELLWNVDVGADSDTATTEYRVQGDLQVLPEHGQFANDSNVTSLTLNFESQTVSVTFGGPGPAGDAGAAGVGLPAGGTTGQIPTKASATDFDVVWSNAGAGDMIAANNLSDLANAATARTNLGLGTAATTAASAYAPALGADDNYVTDAEKIVIGNTSGTNTGDQDLSGYVETTAIDTLAELNAIITNATLIDTNDSRLSDARTPTAHSHTLSDITDAGTAAANDTGDFEASGAVSTHAAITSGVHGISAFGATLIDDVDAATARTTLGVDAAGTDNSTDVTLAGSLDYLSLSGQEITLGSVDLTTDVTGILPAANGGTGASALSSLDVASLGSGAATDGYVATADGAGGVAWEAASGGGGISTGKAIAMAIVFG